jgi:cyclic pyranopterin phosphate synthase
VVHPRFGDVVQAIVERGLQWALVTNGVLAGRWDLSTATWVRVSLDAATPQTYARIRRVPESHFAKACDSITRLRCGVGFVVTPENWREVVMATQLVKNLGGSNIRIGAQFSTAGQDLYAEIRSAAAEKCRTAAELSDDSFTVVNRFNEKLEDLSQGRPSYRRCSYQYFTTYIGADQNLYRCCVYAYNTRGLIASIEGRRLRDVWRQIASPDFAAFDARGCERCQFNIINQAVNEVLTPDPSETFV